MVHVYTGEGKGKTTAALGLACRAVGYGFKVYIVQFMKGNIEYGELKTAERLAPYLTIRQMGRPTFVNRVNPDPEDVRLAQQALDLVEKIVMGGEYDVVILDEINVALEFGLVALDRVLQLMAARPSHVELILTGRGAPEELMESADLVTEMREVKHYYQRGVASREGIEK
jgi:cob(I)alamin adenosyltransferase